MSFSCKGEEAFEVANLLKDHLLPRRHDEAENGIDLSLDFSHTSLYELSDNDAEKIFNECCARRHEWAMGKTAFFFKKILVPQMISHSLENFTNFVNVRNTNWLTKGDILLLRTIQYKKEEFSAMYESLIDLVPSKTEYDWTIVDTAGDEVDDETDDFEALDVTETVFYPVAEGQRTVPLHSSFFNIPDSFSTDPIMPENFLARSPPRGSRESTPILKKTQRKALRPCSETSSPSNEIPILTRQEGEAESEISNDFDVFNKLRDRGAIRQTFTVDDCCSIRADSVSPERKSGVMFKKADDHVSTVTKISPVRLRRSDRKRASVRIFETPPRHVSRISSPRSAKRESRVLKPRDTFSGLHSAIDDNEYVITPNGIALSDMLLKAQIEKEIAMATYYKVLTEKEMHEFSKMTK
ncbi:unnamed protein product [Auanema sp. JU1783]|nr:unnamed protein product [Auanema sp. JU1783]